MKVASLCSGVPVVVTEPEVEEAEPDLDDDDEAEDFTAPDVMAFGQWRNNAELIAHGAVRLGYLRPEWLTRDPTWGLGNFWTLWRPDEGNLIGSDMKADRSPIGRAVDATRLEEPDGTDDVVVLDPPYKFNGASTGRGASSSDAAYGVDEAMRWQDRLQLMVDMLTEAHRVTKPRGLILMKMQDQVVSGHKVWQTLRISNHAEGLGLKLVDQLHLTGHRAQPSGRRQVHSRSNYSTMAIFRKGRK